MRTSGLKDVRPGGLNDRCYIKVHRFPRFTKNKRCFHNQIYAYLSAARNSMLLGKSPQIGITRVSTSLSTVKLYPWQSPCASQIRFIKLRMSIVPSISGRSPSDRSSSDTELERSELRKVEAVGPEENSISQKAVVVVSGIGVGLFGGRLGLLIESSRCLSAGRLGLLGKSSRCLLSVGISSESLQTSIGKIFFEIVLSAECGVGLCVLLAEQGLEDWRTEGEGSFVLDRRAGLRGVSCFVLACGRITARSSSKSLYGESLLHFAHLSSSSPNPSFSWSSMSRLSSLRSCSNCRSSNGWLSGCKGKFKVLSCRIPQFEPLGKLTFFLGAIVV
jgi:hypothetical protein